MKYNLANFANATVHATLISLTVALFLGWLPVHLIPGCIILSGLSAAYAFTRRKFLFKNYASPMDRAQIKGPMIYGTILSSLGALLGGLVPTSLIAAAELAAWLLLFRQHRSNLEQFIRMENGMMLADAWESPPLEALRPGDLILTSGVLGPRAGWVIDHGEVFMFTDEGEATCFSSHWGKGCTFTVALRTLKGALKNGPYYVGRPEPEFTEELRSKLYKEALGMIADNTRWREEATVFRTNLINSLWLPQSAKQWLLKKFLPDGYDWLGMIRGRHSSFVWTCIAACLELYSRLGHQLRKYGVGLFGLFGWFDPIIPIRLFTDRGMRILKTSDEAAFHCTAATASDLSM